MITHHDPPGAPHPADTFIVTTTSATGYVRSWVYLDEVLAWDKWDDENSDEIANRYATVKVELWHSPTPILISKRDITT